MKRKEVKVTLSPNEEAQLIREEQERRRILRIQQVREQQRTIAQRVRQKVEQRRQQELELLAEELRAQWEQQQKERVDHLQRLYQENLSLLGQGHRSAKENEQDLSAANQKAENDSKAEERYRKALKELKLQRLKNQENQNRSADARRKALEVEKIRSAKVASLPLPPQPLQEVVSKPHIVKKCDATSFAATHYHMPETLVDRKTLTSQPSACVEAEQEIQRITLMQRQEEQRREEQQEKARLRGMEALRREQLQQDRRRLLVELEHMQQTDLLRRRQQVGEMPRQIFEPLYRRQETKLDLQRDMEFAFEDMYSGERKVKGDLLCHLVPEPLPPPSMDSLCQDLDVTQEEPTISDQYQAEQDRRTPTVQDQAESESIMPESVEDCQHPKASNESKAAPPRRGLKRLLTRIQTQRRRWSESEVASTNSPCGQDSSIDTGSLTTVDKQSEADVEHSAAVAEKTLELEEQRRREEELETEKREQMDILERLEQQRLQLEERLSEAQRERALLKTSSTPTEPTETTSEPVAGNHTRMMKEHRHRLLQQNEIHKRSVEVARQRLEEYQRALRTRYNMPAIPPSVVPLSNVPKAAPYSAPPPSAVPPSAVPSSAVPSAVVTPSAVPPAVVPKAAAPSALLPTAVPRVPFLHAAVTPSAVSPAIIPPTAFLPAPVPLPAVTHSAGHLHLPGGPRPEEQTPVPRETLSSNMGPLLRPPRSDLGSKTGSDSLTALRHRAFLKFIQDRLGVTHTDLSGHTSSQPSPPVSMVTGPSPPLSMAAGPSPISATKMSSSSVVSAASGPDQVVSSGMGPNVIVSSAAGPTPVVTMTTCTSAVLSTRRDADHIVPTVSGSSGFVSIRAGPGSVLSPSPFLPTGVHPDPIVSVPTESCPVVSTSTHPGPPVSQGVGLGPGLSGVVSERLELWDSENVISQQHLEEDVPTPDKQQSRPKEQEQERSNLLQALLRALERSNIQTSQHEDSDEPSICGSRSASSGSSSVVSRPSSAAPKPPVSRARLSCLDTALHQLSVIEEVNTPASVSLLTGEDAVTVEVSQGNKQADSSGSQSCSLSDFAQYMDSPQSLDFRSGADYSGSSAVSSFQHPAEPMSRPQPSISSTLSTGSYITTDPELYSHPDSDHVPVYSPMSSPAQQNQEGALDQGTAPQTPEFAPVETTEALPTEEPSVLENEDSFRPLVGQMSDQSMCPGAEDVTLGLELLVGHPSAHSSVIGQMPSSTPLITWDSTVGHWREEGLSYVPSGTWQSAGQEFIPTEHPVEGPENEPSADASTNSEFHQLHAEVTHNQMETTEPLDQPGPAELWSPEQMRAEETSHVDLSQWSPPEVLLCPSLKGPVEGMGILEQSQITLVSLTDSSSDEQEPGAEEEAGAQCHQKTLQRLCATENPQ